MSDRLTPPCAPRSRSAATTRRRRHPDHRRRHPSAAAATSGHGRPRPRGQMSFEERLGDLRWRTSGPDRRLARPCASPPIAAPCPARRSASRSRRSRWPATSDRRQVGLRQHRICPRRVTCRATTASPGCSPRTIRLGAGTRADVHRRARRRRALRAHRTGQSGRRRRCAAGRGRSHSPSRWPKARAWPCRNMKDNLDDALHIDYPTALHREAERLVQASRTEDHEGGRARLRREAQLPGVGGGAGA